MQIARKTWIEINLDNLDYNVKKIINSNDKYEYYFGVVKANAYSHGAIEVSKQLIKSGINYLSVSSLEEALEIRNEIKDIPILCLEPIDISYINIAKENNITITINSLEYGLQVLKNNINNLKIHIKIDTGMNRLGIKDKKELEILIENFNEKNIKIEGIFTHFATSDSDDNFYYKQIEKFLYLTNDINLNQFEIIHIDNSAAQLKFKKLPFVNGARLGISIYGINTTKKDIKLKQVLSLYSNIIQIKELESNEGFGYGLKFKAKTKSKIAIIPIGYADGIIRGNTGRYVQINNKKYKIVGTICMDMLAILIDDEVKLNDTVTLIGEGVTPHYIAQHLNTIEYEILCSLSDRILRIYYKNNKIIKKEYKRFK